MTPVTNRVKFEDPFLGLPIKKNYFSLGVLVQIWPIHMIPIVSFCDTCVVLAVSDAKGAGGQGKGVKGVGGGDSG